MNGRLADGLQEPGKFIARAFWGTARVIKQAVQMRIDGR